MRQYVRVFNQFRDWLHRQIASPSNGSGEEIISQHSWLTRRFLLACVLIFLTATAVRLAHWQDSHLIVADGSLPQRYIRHAQRMLNGDGLLFPRDYQDSG